MPQCEYLYCRRPLDSSVSSCPACGFPRDQAQLKDPRFVLAAAPIDGLPADLLDMHQIIPAFDGVLDLQLKVMEHFGIRRALLQSVPDQVPSIWGNLRLQELAASHGNRFWISQFADPRMKNADAALAQLADAGVRVIKLLPVLGFRPDDPACDAFWTTMQERGLVAMVHTGFITARHKEEEARAGVFLNSRYANPLFFDQPARKFPRLRIILCHLGGPTWYEEAAQMVTEHDNVWGDLSGFGVFALERLLKLRAAIDWSKVFWGNDSVPQAYGVNLRLFMNALRDNGREALAPGLLHDNGQRFADQFMT